MLVDTLHGIKRRSTVNLFNMFVRTGKLTEIDQEKTNSDETIHRTRSAVFREIKSIGPVDFKPLVY